MARLFQSQIRFKEYPELFPICDAIYKAAETLEETGIAQPPEPGNPCSRSGLTAIICEAVARVREGYNLFHDGGPIDQDHFRKPDGAWAELDSTCALSAGIIVGNIELVESVLASADVDVNHYSPTFGLPLELAAMYCRPEIVQYLIDRDAETFPRNDLHSWPQWSQRGPARGYQACNQPMFKACVAGNLPVVRLLLRNARCNKPISENHPPGCHRSFFMDFSRSTIAAARHGHADVVDFLLRTHSAYEIPKNYDHSKDLLNNAFIEAVSYGHVPVIEMMVRVFAGDIVNLKILGGWWDDKIERWGLQAAVLTGQDEMVAFLLSRGADPSVRGHSDHLSALSLAIITGRLGTVKTFVSHGSDINGDGLCYWENRSIIMAAKHGSLEILQFLIENGADLEARVFEHQTTTVGAFALRNAVAKGMWEVIRCLLQAGVPVRNWDARLDPYSVAVRYNQHDALRKMKEMGMLKSENANASRAQGALSTKSKKAQRRKRR